MHVLFFSTESLTKIDGMQLVFESTDGSSLFTPEAMHSLCRLEERLIRDYTPSFYSPDDLKCRQLSVPFFVALVSGKESCYSIDNDDMDQAKQLLAECWSSFPGSCSKISDNSSLCTAAHVVMCYLTDTNFISNGTGDSGKTAILNRLKFTVLMVTQGPLIKSNGRVESYFKDFLEKQDTSDGSVRLAGFYLNDNLKFDLFDDYLTGDLWLFGLAMGIILFIMFVYLFSLTLMLSTLLNVAMSFITAFCLYNLIFGIDFFPFINLLAGLILIAIGADDVFIFCDTWEQVKKQTKGLPLDIVVAKTFNHAALSIFVTSLTTSAAFFANSVSSITAIQCFGIFAGLAVLGNFFFMITWTPAIIIMMEKYQRCTKPTALVFGGSILSVVMIPLVVTRLLDFLLQKACTLCNFKQVLSDMSSAVFGKFFPLVIEKLWAVFLLLFFAMGVGGLVVVFYSPKLKLPHSKDIQLFPNSQWIERWDQGLRNQFRYVNEEEEAATQDMEFYFVWGVEPLDNGGKYDTEAHTTLVRDKTFNITSPESQRWMMNFCRTLVQQPFVSADLRALNSSHLHMCFFDRWQVMVPELCTKFASKFKSPELSKFAVCCENNGSIPMSTGVFELCLPFVIGHKHDLESGNSVFVVADMVFDPQTRVPSAFIMNITTGLLFTTSYEEMQKHKETMDNFFNKLISNAPPGLKNGFVSNYDFGFYDLQHSIATGTYFSILLSVGVAFLVMLMTSLNVLITFYALFTIALAIAATIASLVLMGWELNIIESVTISLAVGLSIDFTIHYGVAYRLSTEKYPKGRVQESFARVGSAVVMAAVTTFLAGAAIMPSHIMGYRQLGIFLMLVMMFSWLYATFFFQSLCRLAGPRGNFCQIPVPCGRNRRRASDTELENQPSRGSLMLRSDSEDSLLVTF